jgi:protein involved in polysaccharide export with SLBB domain
MTITVSLAWASSFASEVSSDYYLDAGDKLSVSVFGRTDLSGSFEIRSAGTISLPLIGEVRAAKLTLSQLEDALTKRLALIVQEQFFVNVEIIEYRPFFIDGDVARPGGYPYQSGLTVMRAIALAGGRYSARSRTAISPLEQTRERENFDVLFDSYRADVASEARLIAERDGQETIEFPKDLIQSRRDGRVAEAIDNETHIFATRKDAIDGQIAILQKRKAQAQEEISALKAQRRASEKRRRILAERLRDIQKLSAKQFVLKSDAMNLELLRTDAETRSQNIRASITQARQEISKIEQSIANLRGQRAEEVAMELEEVQQRLTQTLVRLEAASKRLALIEGVDSLEPADLLQDPKEVFYVTREMDDGQTVIEATDDTLLLPGDVVQVPFRKISPVPVPSRISAPWQRD